MVGALGVFLLPTLFAKPYRIRSVDRLRSIVRLWFKNRHYTELVARAATPDPSVPYIAIPRRTPGSPPPPPLPGRHGPPAPAARPPPLPRRLPVEPTLGIR
jgi:hypothetical protein